jgi:hypothetical protein
LLLDQSDKGLEWHRHSSSSGNRHTLNVPRTSVRLPTEPALDLRTAATGSTPSRMGESVGVS